MEYYNKIVESLGIRFSKAGNSKQVKPFTIMDYYDVDNTVILVHNGEIFFDEEEEPVREGDILFIPGGRATKLTYGNGKKNEMSYEDFKVDKRKYLQSISFHDLREVREEKFTTITFETKVFDVVNFFSSLSIPPFVIKFNDKIAYIIEELAKESEGTQQVGKERIIQVTAESLVIEIVRHILKNRLFVEELTTNSTYFKDPRLIAMFNHIKQNIGGDLSNKVLAKVANVSEDYVGQYFKMLTGINPQDYIEYQRMEAAINLLRTTKDSIRDIGRKVGYKDTAYFCRRFKMMYGIPAGKMRRRETLINV
ncbi:helix-turn-helix domain-containing protein [Penaeicola halotolerans]|uniref:helix-turn-helix domain-containing protein n=1 Tax=Penaeicola halotolerans TaxID=2793196 RepID=UPI001CF8CEE9|nr:helix-turn-helix domain-containing protein [Penaeicola halotolerans]